MSAEDHFITIVSGLPRSGTSMMMKMLNEGGMELVTDNIRKADEDNLNGYYEFERIKQIKDDNHWLSLIEKKVVKMVSRLLVYLPEEYNYKVIFMRRNMEEILASQEKMLHRRGKPVNQDRKEMAKLFRKHLDQVEEWLNTQSNIDVLYINYNGIIKDPESKVHSILEFLNLPLDIQQMCKVVNPDLYRQRS